MPANQWTIPDYSQLGGIGMPLTDPTTGFIAPGGVPTSGLPAVGVGGLVAPGSSGGLGGLGLNTDTFKLGLAGLGTIGSLWSAWQSQKLAKEQFKYTKGVTDTNLNNSIATYNTGLTDRANNRAIVEGNTPAATQAYIDANSLKRYGS